MATTNEISPIEHLRIDYPFIFDELSATISYTPQVRRLKIRLIYFFSSFISLKI